METKMETKMNFQEISIKEYYKLTAEEKEKYNLEMFEAAVSSSDFKYARARSWRASGQVVDESDYIIYAYGTTDITPFIHSLASLNDFKSAIALLNKYNRAFPLSPTEKY